MVSFNMSSASSSVSSFFAGRRDFFCALCRFHFNLAVTGESGAGGNEMAHNDVFLEAFQGIGLAEGGCFRQNARGILERCRGNEGFRFQGGLRDTEQNGFGCGRLAALGYGLFIDAVERGLVHLVSPQEFGISRFRDDYLAEHLAHDDFHMLVVDFHTPGGGTLPELH